MMAGMEALIHDGEQPIAARQRRPRRAAATSGVRAIAPLVMGLAPLALTVGASAARADLPPLVGWASSALLYGASGQLTWMGVLDGGGPAAVAVIATVVVNLQMLLYGAAMRTYWASESRGWRIGAAQLMVSPVFAVATSHHPTEPDRQSRSRFYMAAAMTLWIAWLAMTGIGYALGGLPSVPVLALVTPLVMLTLALRAVIDSATIAALITAAALAIVGTGLPYDLGTVGAGIAGVIIGITVDSRSSGKHDPRQETRT
jgi:predicted branched-subunit amino acid permease